MGPRRLLAHARLDLQTVTKALKLDYFNDYNYVNSRLQLDEYCDVLGKYSTPTRSHL